MRFEAFSFGTIRVASTDLEQLGGYEEDCGSKGPKARREITILTASTLIS